MFYILINFQLKMNAPRHYFKTGDSNQHIDAHQFFQFYNQYFFKDKLDKCVVRWTKRMTLCAGTCKFEGFQSSTISLSQPLLKFRSPDQFKQTLLHQMIHAYLFITDPESCRYDGGHGPKFKQIMNRINSQSGLNLTIYHNFKDQVDYYRTHIWRCNGRCQEKPPYFGYVKRATNRKPQPADSWWTEHKRSCGGQFVKISEPEKSKSKQKAQQSKNKRKNSKKLKSIKEQKDSKSWGYGKSIEEYIKEMNQQSQKKRTSSKLNEELYVKKQENVFAGKGKTLQEYQRQIKNNQYRPE